MGFKSTGHPLLHGPNHGPLMGFAELCRVHTGQFKATSPGITLSCGLYREWYQNGLKLGIEIILNTPV